jgi:hypothetical protein
MSYNHKALMGQEARINQDLESLGIITDSYHEGQTHWLQIDGSYELAVQSVEIVADLANGIMFARPKPF